jgi:hypothetical protein
LATPFADVKQYFLNKISDFDLAGYTEEIIDGMLDKYMFSACSKFNTSLVDLLDLDLVGEKFNNDLDFEIIDIITEGMIVEWLKPKIFHTDNLSNFLNSKDTSLAASPANILNAIKSVYEESRDQFKRLVTEYGYQHSDASDL